MKISEISQKEFDAVCYARNAHLLPLLEEVKYYKEQGGILYGVIARDRLDGDYGCVLLGRDANKRFRAIEVPSKFYDTPEEALVELQQMFLKVGSEGAAIHPQGDEKGKPNELYEVVAKKDKIHPLFTKLTGDPVYDCAKTFIGEAVYSYVDVDGNYIKDFQSTGFNSRLWELYLYILIKNQRFKIDSSFHAPDYLINKSGVTIAIEATTVNSDANFDQPLPENGTEIFNLMRDYMPIKFGSSLYSKLQKKYWELDHVNGIPLVIAIHDYHMEELLPWAQNSLRDYLYGSRYKTTLEDGVIKLCLDSDHLPIPEKISRHVYKHKDIPSDFFSQPGAEYVSAVLFCNNATLDTFNRYGKLAKMGNYKGEMFRVAEVNDLNSPVYTPKIVEENIENEKYCESWGDTICLFHNPRAKYPIDRSLFSGISQCSFNVESGRYVGPRRLPEFLRSCNKYK